MVLNWNLEKNSIEKSAGTKCPPGGNRVNYFSNTDADKHPQRKNLYIEVGRAHLKSNLIRYLKYMAL